MRLLCTRPQGQRAPRHRRALRGMKLRTSKHRLNKLDGVFERRSRVLLIESFTDDVVVAFDGSPLGPHIDRSARVLRALGRAAIAGKETVISLGEEGPWGSAYWHCWRNSGR